MLFLTLFLTHSNPLVSETHKGGTFIYPEGIAEKQKEDLPTILSETKFNEKNKLTAPKIFETGKITNEIFEGRYFVFLFSCEEVPIMHIAVDAKTYSNNTELERKIKSLLEKYLQTRNTSSQNNKRQREKKINNSSCSQQPTAPESPDIPPAKTPALTPPSLALSKKGEETLTAHNNHASIVPLNAPVAEKVKCFSALEQLQNPHFFNPNIESPLISMTTGGSWEELPTDIPTSPINAKA